MSADSLRRASKHQIFRAISVALGHTRDTVANRDTDASGNPGADVASCCVDTTTDAGPHGPSNDGCVSQNHEFRIQPVHPHRSYGNPSHLHEPGYGHPHRYRGWRPLQFRKPVNGSDFLLHFHGPRQLRVPLPDSSEHEGNDRCDRLSRAEATRWLVAPERRGRHGRPRESCWRRPLC